MDWLTTKQACKILKDKGRICLIAPIINTLDGNGVQLNIEEIAKRSKFKQLPLIDSNRLVSKSNPKLKFSPRAMKNLIDAKKGQIVNRKLYIFEKNEEM